jgi:hypothetical protein
MRRNSGFRRALPLVAVVSLLAGIVSAAPFFFTISFQSWDDIPDVNEAAVQTRAGQLNRARAVGDTVRATFSDNRSGDFLRVLLISSNAFQQTGGPYGGGGGGGCAVASPASTLLSVDGAAADLGRGSAAPLTVLGTADDGTRVVVDQFAIASVLGVRTRLSGSSFGFSKVLDTTRVDHELRSAMSGKPTTALLIQHQGAHPANHNFAKVLFRPQDFRPTDVSMRRGWAAMTFGKTGQLHDVALLSEHGARTSPDVAAALRAAVRTEFLDDRRHAHTVYFAFEVTDRQIHLKGQPIVTMPMCCPCETQPGGGQCP